MSLWHLIALSLALGVGAWLFFLWSVRSGQHDDPEGPEYRMLTTRTRGAGRRSPAAARRRATGPEDGLGHRRSIPWAPGGSHAAPLHPASWRSPRNLLARTQRSHRGRIYTLTFPVIRALVDEVVTVTDAQLVEAMRFFAERMKLVVVATALASAAPRTPIPGRRPEVTVDEQPVPGHVERHGRHLRGHGEPRVS